MGCKGGFACSDGQKNGTDGSWHVSCMPCHAERSEASGVSGCAPRCFGLWPLHDTAWRHGVEVSWHIFHICRVIQSAAKNLRFRAAPPDASAYGLCMTRGGVVAARCRGTSLMYAVAWSHSLTAMVAMPSRAGNLLTYPSLSPNLDLSRSISALYMALSPIRSLTLASKSAISRSNNSLSDDTCPLFMMFTWPS